MADTIIKPLLIEHISQDILKYINEYAKQDCNGCRINHPSQREHTCLGITYTLENYDILESYFDLAYTEKQGFILQKLQDALQIKRKYVLDVYLNEKQQIYLKVKELNDGTN